jgi:ATP phosphoribosyltransferase
VVFVFKENQLKTKRIKKLRDLALPSGKSMEDGTLEVLKAAHVHVKRPHPRLCTATISGISGIRSAAFIKPSQIPRYVSTGQIPVGITGEDAVRENGANVKIVAELPYSRATVGGTRCVMFCRDGDRIKSLRGLNGKTIVSEYPKETKAFLKKNNIRAKVVPCTGSAETLVVIGLYRFGVALTETGTSLSVNNLREIGTVFESQTVLIANKFLYGAVASFRERVDFLGRSLRGVLNARTNILLLMNVPVEKVKAVCKILPRLKSPTVDPQEDPAYRTITTVVPADELYGLKRRLERIGASGFVESAPASVQ